MGKLKGLKDVKIGEMVLIAKFSDIIPIIILGKTSSGSIKAAQIPEKLYYSYPKNTHEVDELPLELFTYVRYFQYYEGVNCFTVRENIDVAKIKEIIDGNRKNKQKKGK